MTTNRPKTLSPRLCLLASCGVLLFCALVIRWQILPHFFTHFLGGRYGDAGLYQWLIKVTLSTPGWFETPMFYPYGQTLAWSDNFYLPALLSGGLEALGLPFPAAYNIVILGATLATGLSSLALCRTIGASYPASVAGAVAFQSYGFFTGHLGHPQLQFAFAIPLVLAILFSYLRRPRSWLGAVAGLVLTGSFLCSIYYTIFAALALCTALLGALILRPTKSNANALGTFAVTTIVGLLPAIPFALPYLDVQREFGGRNLYEPFSFAADGLSYLAASPWSFAYKGFSALSHSEAQLFPGAIVLIAVAAAFLALVYGTRALTAGSISLLLLLITLTLSTFGDYLPRTIAAIGAWLFLAALIWLLRSIRIGVGRTASDPLSGREHAGLLVWVAGVAIVLSLGPLGDPNQGEWALAPFRFFYELFPGVGAVRAVGRFGVVVFAALTAVIAFGVHAISRGRPAILMLSIAIGSLSLVEQLPALIPREPDRGVPPAFSFIAQRDDAGAPIIVLPLSAKTKPSGEPVSWGEYAHRNVSALHFARESRAPVINGYSGLRPKVLYDLLRRTRFFPDQRSIDALGAIAGLRYVVYSAPDPKHFDRAAFLTRIAPFSEQLNFLIGDEDGNLVFELNPYTAINKDFRLLVPPSSAGALVLELAVPAPRAEPVELVVFRQGSREPLTSISVAPGGDFALYSVPLSSPTDRIRPQRIYFVAADGSTAILRKRDFVRLSD